MNLECSFSGCGIVGAAHFKNGSAIKIREHQFSEMLSALKHRGPDSSQIWYHNDVFLGHTRLSILDLSDRGKQPMVRGNLIITHNGEVYNFMDIREKLEKLGINFESQTDTEVILRAYQIWGVDCLQEFNGMFAFCIYDLDKKTLFLARDHIGIKPLYYYIDNNYFLFSSEVQSLMKSAYIPKIVNTKLLYQQVLFSSSLHHHADQTLINNVWSLLPGHYLTVNLAEGTQKICKYWSLPDQEFDQVSKDNAEQLSHLLEKSIQYRLISDVPVASFLSGGIDSSLITAIASRSVSAHKLHCYTVSYQGMSDVDSKLSECYEDLEHSKLLAQNLEEKVHHHLIQLPFQKFNIDLIDSVIDFANLTEDPRLVAVYNNYKALRDNKIKVVLNGQGADELMGGYFAINPLVIGAVNDPYSKDDVKNWFQSCTLPNQTIINNHVLNIKNETYEELFNTLDSFHGSPLRKVHCFLTMVALQRILKFEDLLSMRFGIECRVPFLDHEIINWVFSIPFEKHIDLNKNVGKALLKEVARTYLPDKIINRPKKPFPRPSYQEISNSLILYVQNQLNQIRKDDLVRSIYNEKMLDVESLTFHELWSIVLIFRWNQLLQSL